MKNGLNSTLYNLPEVELVSLIVNNERKKRLRYYILYTINNHLLRDHTPVIKQGYTHQSAERFNTH